MISILATGAGYQVKMAIDGSNEERTVGFATKLNYSVMNGQKMIFTVDSPFPQEIANGAAQSYVRGTMNLFMPRGMTLEALNVTPHRHDEQGAPVGPFTKYFSIRVYDRLSRGLVLSLDFCKISQYTVDVTTRAVVQATVSFEGILASPGNANL